MGSGTFKSQPRLQEGPRGAGGGVTERGGGQVASPCSLHPLAWILGSGAGENHLRPTPTLARVLAGVSLGGSPCRPVGSTLENHFLESPTDLAPIIFLSYFPISPSSAILFFVCSYCVVPVPLRKSASLRAHPGGELPPDPLPLGGA